MRVWAAIAVAVVTGVMGVRAHGAPLDGTTLPGDTKWVMHLDVETAQKTRIWTAMGDRLSNAEARGNVGRNMQPMAEGKKRIQVLADQLGITLPTGLFDVTLYGADYASEGSVIRIHAEMDEKHAEELLTKDPTYKREEYTGSVILSWKPKGKEQANYAGFSAKKFVLFSSDLAVVKKGLDALDGTGRLATDSPLNPVPITVGAAAGGGRGAGPEQPALWMAGVNLPELPGRGRAESPVLEHLQSASLGIVPVGPVLGGIHIVARGTADTSNAARDIELMVDGLKGSADLAATAAGAKPRQVALGELMQAIRMSASGQQIEVDFNQRPLAPAQLELLIGLVQQETAAPGGGRGAAAGGRGAATQP